VPDPFITVEDLTAYLGRDVTADDGAVIAIDAACDICRTIAERQFNAGTSTIMLDGTGTDAVLLSELPVNTVGTVTVNGTEETDYLLTDNGMLLRGTAGVYPREAWDSGRRNVTVTYTHGYETIDIPRDVRMVALSIASRLVIQGVALEEAQGTSRIKYAAAATDLTKGEERILAKYKPR
jgi:hypothetical protein